MELQSWSKAPGVKWDWCFQIASGLTDREILCCHLLLSLPSRWPRSELPFLFWARIRKYCIDTTHPVYDFGLRLSDELCQTFRKIRAYNYMVVLFYDLQLWKLLIWWECVLTPKLRVGFMIIHLFPGVCASVSTENWNIVYLSICPGASAFPSAME